MAGIDADAGRRDGGGAGVRLPLPVIVAALVRRGIRMTIVSRGATDATAEPTAAIITRTVSASLELAQPGPRVDPARAARQHQRARLRRIDVGKLVITAPALRSQRPQDQG